AVPASHPRCRWRTSRPAPAASPAARSPAPRRPRSAAATPGPAPARTGTAPPRSPRTAPASPGRRAAATPAGDPAATSRRRLAAARHGSWRYLGGGEARGCTPTTPSLLGGEGWGEGEAWAWEPKPFLTQPCPPRAAQRRRLPRGKRGAKLTHACVSAAA